MRDIKFRAKKMDGFWAYGFYAKEVHHKSKKLTSVIRAIYDESNYVDYFVDEETIGQYTGIKDKNGKMIYEGDIVKIDNDTISEVVFDEGAFCWCEYSDGYVGGRFTHSFNDHEYYCFCEAIEVIGNVYDNPELLNKEGDYYDKNKR